jgi:hypothetical protein
MRTNRGSLETDPAKSAERSGAGRQDRGGVVGDRALGTDVGQALALLEDDQFVAVKAGRRLGRASLSKGVRALLWCLRIYVVLMILLVAFQAFQVLRAGQ